MSSKPRLLFVCIENSNRSQMAEGFARFYGSAVEVFSAGSRPSGKINPKAIAMMAEIGIDLTVQKSFELTDLPSVDWDWIVTMGCGDACPHLSTKNRDDWALQDPKHLADQEFREVRDDIRERVLALLKKCEVSVDLQ